MTGRVGRRVGACALAACLGVAGGCSEPVPVPEGRVRIVIKGEAFDVEPALDQASRTLGLGGRESLEPRGGMIFVFPSPLVLNFVMRDCPYPIDIAYCADNGRIVTMYEMKAEEPRREGETAMQYEMRLPRYSSRFPVRFAIEVPGGTWERLSVQQGDVIEFDAEDLKARVR